MKVWVVEMWNAGKKRWEPCADCHLSKRSAVRAIKSEWEYNCPDDRFRVRAYVAKESA